MQNVRKFAVLFLEIRRHKVHLFTRNDSLRSDVYPQNLYLMMPKSLISHDPSFEKGLNPPGGSILLKFSQVVA